MKIYVPLKKVKLNGALTNIILAGIESHPELDLIDDERDSDFIFLDYRHIRAGHKINHPHKTILIDYTDRQQILALDVFLYFKRSVVIKETLPYAFNSNVAKGQAIPISYAIKNDALNWHIRPLIERKIDVSIFCEPVPERRARAREHCAQTILNNLKEYNTFVGTIGSTGKEGRNSIQEEYYNKILDSKIVVTCNPDRWEGDYRLFEALSCAPLVMVDQMLTPVQNKFIDCRHLVYYDRNNTDNLIDRIKYYLKNLGEASGIASDGYQHAIKYHTTRARMDEIIFEIRKKSSESSNMPRACTSSEHMAPLGLFSKRHFPAHAFSSLAC